MSLVRKLLFYISNIVTIIAPIALLFFPVDFFDKGESICLSVQLAGIECYACGLTKAIMHLLHFDFAGAWNFNKLSFIVFPMMGVLWVKAIYDIQGKRMPGFIGKLTYPKEA
ncbi:DUF2752 domain-containing protein [Flavobacterium sp.]|uniref:DUF2752 domain-containing protein n=1 Tax=Flavobacterium sp. TaxID=239 RepID=UPI0025B9DD1D|nr:DUF2752 domain-containing protein [Flavobacterium sp.]